MNNDQGSCFRDHLLLLPQFVRVKLQSQLVWLLVNSVTGVAAGAVCAALLEILNRAVCIDITIGARGVRPHSVHGGRERGIISEGLGNCDQQAREGGCISWVFETILGKCVNNTLHRNSPSYLMLLS